MQDELPLRVGEPMLDEVGGRRPGGASGGDVLDGTGVVPGAALSRFGVEDIGELRADARETGFEIVDHDPRAGKPTGGDRNDQVWKAGGDDLHGEAVEVPGIQVQGPRRCPRLLTS